MGNSLKELKTALESKGGFTATVNSLQDLKNLLDNLGAVRTTTVEDDVGQNVSGVLCTGHSWTNYTGGLSFQQISDASVNLKQLQCSEKIMTNAYCSTRTAVTCECNTRADTTCASRTITYDNTGCTCAGRYSTYPCACNAQQVCGARCNCAARTVSFGVQPECECDGRTITCVCEARTCSYDCACNSQAICASRTATVDYPGCTCVSRQSVPACECNTRADTTCSCNSRTACTCDTRCSCNAETQYA